MHLNDASELITGYICSRPFHTLLPKQRDLGPGQVIMRSTAESIVSSLSAKQSLTNVLFTMRILDIQFCGSKTILGTQLYVFRWSRGIYFIVKHKFREHSVLT